jgi:hypothetical protein
MAESGREVSLSSPTAVDAIMNKPVRQPPREPIPRPDAEQSRADDPSPSRHLHRERDFGIGYGNSSGYGRDDHYAHPFPGSLFRCH